MEKAQKDPPSAPAQGGIRIPSFEEIEQRAAAQLNAPAFNAFRNRGSAGASAETRNGTTTTSIVDDHAALPERPPPQPVQPEVSTVPQSAAELPARPAPQPERSSAAVVRQPTAQAQQRPTGERRGPTRSRIIVSRRQEQNPLLKHIRNVPYEFGTILADYQVGATAGVLFLSLMYHRLHPEYLTKRLEMLQHHFQHRILLVLVDVDDHESSMLELTLAAMQSNLLLIVATSNEEAARYLESFKAFENKSPDALKERTDRDYLSRLTECLTQVRGVNKTDVVTLLAAFGSFEGMAAASADELALCNGFGERKIRRFLDIFQEPFRYDRRRPGALSGT